MIECYQPKLPCPSLKTLSIYVIHDRLLPLHKYLSSDKRIDAYWQLNKEFLNNLNALPEELIQLISSTYLKDRREFLDQSILLKLSELPKLADNVWRNHYYEAFEQTDLENLKKLRLPNVICYATLSITSSFKNLPYLRKLSLNLNHSFGIGIVWQNFSHLTNLNNLVITSRHSFNIIKSKSGLKAISISLPNLIYLELDDDNWNGEGLQFISSLTNLQGLRINGNFRELSNFSFPTNLRYLSIINTNKIIYCKYNINLLNNLTLLQGLCLREINLKEQMNELNITLNNLTNLQLLSLASNNLTEIPSDLNLSNLDYLNISKNSLKHESVSNLLANATNLKALELHYCLLNTTSYTKLNGLINLTNLVYLNLCFNSLSDSMSPVIMTLTHLSSKQINTEFNITPICLLENNLFNKKWVKLVEFFNIANVTKFERKILNLDELDDLRLRKIPYANYVKNSNGSLTVFQNCNI